MCPTRWDSSVLMAVWSRYHRLVGIVHHRNIEWGARTFSRSHSLGFRTHFWPFSEMLLHKECHDALENTTKFIFLQNRLDRCIPICTPSINSPERPLVNLNKSDRSVHLQNTALTTCTNNSENRLIRQIRWVPYRCSKELDCWMCIYNLRLGLVKMKKYSVALGEKQTKRGRKQFAKVFLKTS